MDKYQALDDSMVKLLKNKPYNVNRNHVNKIADQIKALNKNVVVAETN